MSKLFNTDVSHDKCQEWLGLIEPPITPLGAIAARELRDEILMSLGREVVSNFANEFAPVEPVLEVVK